MFDHPTHSITIFNNNNVCFQLQYHVVSMNPPFSLQVQHTYMWMVPQPQFFTSVPAQPYPSQPYQGMVSNTILQ